MTATPLLPSLSNPNGSWISRLWHCQTDELPVLRAARESKPQTMGHQTSSIKAHPSRMDSKRQYEGSQMTGHAHPTQIMICTDKVYSIRPLAATLWPKTCLSSTSPTSQRLRTRTWPSPKEVCACITLSFTIACA